MNGANALHALADVGGAACGRRHEPEYALRKEMTEGIDVAHGRGTPVVRIAAQDARSRANPAEAAALNSWRRTSGALCSTEAPDCLTTSPQRTILVRTNACNSSGNRVGGNEPNAGDGLPCLRRRHDGLELGMQPVDDRLWRRRRHDHHLPRGGFEPGTPSSAIGAMSGAAAARVLVVTPSARNLPSRINCREEVKSVIITCNRPPIRSTWAATAARYGTCTIWMPVMLLNSSA